MTDVKARRGDIEGYAASLKIGQTLRREGTQEFLRDVHQPASTATRHRASRNAKAHREGIESCSASVKVGRTLGRTLGKWTQEHV